MRCAGGWWRRRLQIRMTKRGERNAREGASDGERDPGGRSIVLLLEHLDIGISFEFRISSFEFSPPSYRRVRCSRGITHGRSIHHWPGGEREDGALL
jgi:hypothetical protein